MTNLYNLYKKVPPHRNNYEKIFSTDSMEELNNMIDKQLFMYGVKPDELIVRRAGFEPDRISENLYGYD